MDPTLLAASVTDDPPAAAVPAAQAHADAPAPAPASAPTPAPTSSSAAPAASEEAKPSTSTAAPAGAPEAAKAHAVAELEAEVQQVLTSVSSWWGGFRKQSQSALEASQRQLANYAQTAKKDLDAVAVKAQAEITRLSAAPTDKGKSRATEGEDSDSPTPTPTPAQAFLSRLSTSASHLRSSLASQEPKLRAQLSHLSLEQAERLAETYLHRGETALGELGSFLSEAVKIVPPLDDQGRPVRVDWDGGWDPTLEGNAGAGVVGRAPAQQPRESMGSATGRQGSVGGEAPPRRKDVLLKRLREEGDALRSDPSEEKGWEEWAGTDVSARITDAEKEAVKGVFAGLVPAVMDEQTFWRRYFFRVGQIEADEARRKALLEGAASAPTDEDFSWDMDDEDRSPTSPSPAHTSPSPAPGKTPRESTDGSYDVVSSADGKAPSSSSVSAAEQVKKAGEEGKKVEGWEKKEVGKEEKRKEEESEDSDWE